MKNKICLITLLLLSPIMSQGYGMDKKIEVSKEVSILGMVLLKKNNTLNITNVIKELEDDWDLSVSSENDSDDETAVLIINGYRIAIGNVAAPIPTDEALTAVKYNFYWENGTEQVKTHKGHIIVAIMNAGKNPVKENMLFSKVASAVMNNSKSIGIYIGDRTLTIEKNFYLDQTKMMDEDNLPLLLWVFFGLRQEEDGQSIYTYGLSNFGKKEMEIINSKHSFQDLNEIIYDMSHYVIANNVELKAGETIGFSESQRLKISESKGIYLEGSSLKILY